MNIELKFTVEKIDNGLLVTHVQSGRRIHEPHDFRVCALIERLTREQVEVALRELGNDAPTDVGE